MSEKDSKRLLAANNELRRSLTRLSFVGNGLSKSLDQALSDLRQAVKDDADEKSIQRCVDQISEKLRNMEEPTSSGSVIEIFDPEKLVDDLAQQSLPKTMRREFLSLKSNLGASASEIAEQMAQIIEQYIRQQEQSLEQTGTEAKSIPQPKKGFFSRLFGFASSTDSADENKETSESTEQVKPQINEALRSSLNNLAAQLSVMDGYVLFAKTLKQKINALDEVAQLSEILELIASAFCEFAGHEHRQFEAFLKQLSRRIERINSFISASVDHHAESAKASDELEDDLKQSVSNIHSSLVQSASLEEVKSNVATKIDTIIERVNLFVVNQSKARDNFEQETIKLRDQLKATEDESSRLRQSLAEQRSRAQTDPLTQLPNRYSYNDRLTQEYNRWRRYRSPLTMVIADIDLFKSINDNHGHAVGDKILQAIAINLSNRLRESDFIARFGGEEFVILLPETNLVAATKVMNKLRQEIANKSFKINESIIQLTLSFGVSEFENNDTSTEVFERADKALYRAKEKGRNQVCCQRATNKN